MELEWVLIDLTRGQTTGILSHLTCDFKCTNTIVMLLFKRATELQYSHLKMQIGSLVCMQAIVTPNKMDLPWPFSYGQVGIR